MKGVFFILFGLMFFKSFCQVLPPGFELNIEKGNISIASAQKDYDFISLVFDKNVKYKAERYFSIKREDGSYRNARVFAGQQRDFGPSAVIENGMIVYQIEEVKIGEVVSLLIRKKSTGNIMTLFFRCKSKFQHSDLLKLNNLQFKKGVFFFDYCTTINKYGLLHNMSNELSFDNGKYAAEGVIDIKKFRVRIKKLNRIIRKTSCFE